MHFFVSGLHIQDASGITGDFSVDHLWFILFLFVISAVALGLILLVRRQSGLCPIRNVSLPVLCLLFIPVWLLNFVGFSVTGYTFMSYFAMFLIGYSLLALDQVLPKLEEDWAVLLAAWILLTIGVMLAGGIMLGHYEVFWGTSPFYVLTGWTGVLPL